jgi:Phage integrase family
LSLVSAGRFRCRYGSTRINPVMPLSSCSSRWPCLEFREAGDWISASPLKAGRLPYSYTVTGGCSRHAAKAAGLGHIGTHSFRHSYRSWLYAVGTALTVQQKLMRHSDIQTTFNLRNVVTDEMRQASARVADFSLQNPAFHFNSIVRTGNL